MHSHPVLLWTWRTVVTLVGGLLLLAGLLMWVTPGPGWAAVILGLAVLASEFGWARALLRRARYYAWRIKERALERGRRRVSSGLAGNAGGGPPPGTAARGEGD